MPGYFETRVDVDSGEVTVRFDLAMTSVKDIETAILEYGYEVTEVGQAHLVDKRSMSPR